MRDPNEFRYRFAKRPRTSREGEPVYAMLRTAIEKRDETALILSLITNRKLFGWLYWGLQPDYFDNMPPNSGVFLRPLVRTSILIPDAAFPGDIDLLVIPYESNELLLHRVIAIEMKVLRGRFAKQGKSPNEIGHSQARALIALGFPFVALVHLIVSDEGPIEMWREIGVARIIDKEWRAELLEPQPIDWLPINLMKRTYGRLEAAVPSTSEIGIAAVYLGSTTEHITGHGRAKNLWIPDVRRALPNPGADKHLLERIVAYFCARPKGFFDAPRYDPPRRSRRHT